MNSRFALALVLLISGLLPLEVTAQGSKSDYERSAALARRTENKVYRAQVQPQWFAGQSRLWYRVQTGANAHEFIFVDADKGERRLAFDHLELAAALGRTLKREFKPTALPLENLEFDAAGTLNQVRAAGKQIRFNSDAKEWHEIAADEETDDGGLLLNASAAIPR